MSRLTHYKIRSAVQSGSGSDGPSVLARQFWVFGWSCALSWFWAVVFSLLGDPLVCWQRFWTDNKWMSDFDVGLCLTRPGLVCLDYESLSWLGTVLTLTDVIWDLARTDSELDFGLHWLLCPGCLMPNGRMDFGIACLCLGILTWVMTWLWDSVSW